MSAEYRKSNEHFTFHNENPKGKLRAQDCVIRALGYANDGWDNVFNDLCKIGFELKNTLNSDEVMEKYLELKGWVKQKQPRKSNGKKYTIQEWTKKNKNGIIIVRMSGHVSVIDNDKIIDTWDCGDCCLGNYWTKNKA